MFWRSTRTAYSVISTLRLSINLLMNICWHGQAVKTVINCCKANGYGNKNPQNWQETPSQTKADIMENLTVLIYPKTWHCPENQQKLLWVRQKVAKTPWRSIASPKGQVWTENAQKSPLTTLGLTIFDRFELFEFFWFLFWIVSPYFKRGLLPVSRDSAYTLLDIANKFSLFLTDMALGYVCIEIKFRFWILSSMIAFFHEHLGLGLCYFVSCEKSIRFIQLLSAWLKADSIALNYLAWLWILRHRWATTIIIMRMATIPTIHKTYKYE